MAKCNKCLRGASFDVTGVNPNREWHENIQAILKKVDALIEEVANENRL